MDAADMVADMAGLVTVTEGMENPLPVPRNKKKNQTIKTMKVFLELKKTLSHFIALKQLFLRRTVPCELAFNSQEYPRK